MANPRADHWTEARKAFADQFEQYGSVLVYRRSQKGPAISITTEERTKFTEEFDRNIRRAKWIIFVGLAVVLGGIVGFSLLRGTDLSQTAIFIGVGVVTIPYFAYYRWAWAAPARELARRTPVAGERSPDEVRRLRFERISYGQLAIAAAGGLAIPFIGSSRQDVFAGWNRLWLVVGGALVLIAAVQAFRKWLLDHAERDRDIVRPLSNPKITEHDPDSQPSTKSSLWRYLPLVLTLLALALVAYTSAGRAFAKQPLFWPIVMIAFGGWSLFTVMRALSIGRIEPFARGFYQTYERKMQPKRFWASMGWNALLGCLFLWFALMTIRQTSVEDLSDRCYDTNAYSAGKSLSACDALLDAKPTDSNAYLNRGLIYLAYAQFDEAVADFTRAHELNRGSPWPLANRGLSYAWKNDARHAEKDFQLVRAMDASNPVMLRGEAILRMNAGDKRGAVDRLTGSMKRDPDNLWAVRKRAELYWDLGDVEKSREDDSRWQKLNAKARATAK